MRPLMQQGAGSLMTTERKILILGALAAVLVLLTGWLFLERQRSGDAFAACRKGAVAGGMDAFGAAFTLTDETGARVTDQEVFAKPSLLYFGYTFCPDVCPLDNARNAEAIDLLKAKGRDMQGVFITVDPARDTPEALRDFTDSLSQDITGLTGSEAEIAAVNKGWRNYYKAQDGGEGAYYLVDHMTNTYLVLPGGKTVEFFGRDVTPAEMAERVGCFLDAAG